MNGAPLIKKTDASWYRYLEIRVANVLHFRFRDWSR
jgi:hypothetical protein